MNPAGNIFKRCGCRDPETGKYFGNRCPKLRRQNRAWNPTHGVWAYQLELPPAADGHRRLLRRAGIDTREAAYAELDHARQLLDLAGRDRRHRAAVAELLQNANRTALPFPDIEDIRTRLRNGNGNSLQGAPTLAQWLPRWVERITVDASTRRSYEVHVRLHILPVLGDIPLDKLRPHHIEDLFAAVKARNAQIIAAKTSPDPAVRRTVAGVRPTGPATIARTRATLRNAFNEALRKEIVVGVANPAALIKTPNPRPKPIVWEPERIQRWRTTGKIPGPVMVWTAALVAEFLEYAAVHAPDLHPIYHLLAYRGPRRGEACGLLDAEVRLDQKEVGIVNQIAILAGTLIQKPPKSEAGNRDLILDPDTVAVLTAYRARRAAWKLAAGPTWPDTGLFFVQPNGQPWHPNFVSRTFAKLAQEADLPPVRLHDLRHSAATIALDAGVDIKVVSEQLGHTTTTLTRDTYQSVTKHLHHQAADAVANTIRQQQRTA